MIDLTTTEALIFALCAIILGILMLLKGGDWTVDAAVYVAVHFGISPMVVGFTIVAIGTSLPELVVSLIANMQGSGGIAIGNVLGSNIANVLLVIGATALFVTLKVEAKSVLKDLVMMLIASVILVGLLLNGHIDRLAGAGMVGLLVSYVLWQYKSSKGKEIPQEKEMEKPDYGHKYAPYFFLFIGLICIALGAEFLVRGARMSAGIIGVPEAVIALSIIALGTSLPELSTCIIAGRRGHSDIVIGNIVGSNVFNILMIIGVTALVSPIKEGTFAQQLVDFDMWLTLGISVLFALILLFYGKITKGIGAIFFSAYVVYNIYIYAIHFANIAPQIG